jgi:hypothetical protein
LTKGSGFVYRENTNVSFNHVTVKRHPDMMISSSMTTFIAMLALLLVSVVVVVRDERGAP